MHLELAGHPYKYVHMYRIYINSNIYIYTHPRAVHIYQAHGYIDIPLHCKSIGKRMGIDGNRDKVTQKNFFRESIDIGESCIDRVVNSSCEV